MRICRIFEIFPPKPGPAGAGARWRFSSMGGGKAACTFVVQRARGDGSRWRVDGFRSRRWTGVWVLVVLRLVVGIEAGGRFWGQWSGSMVGVSAGLPGSEVSGLSQCRVA